ncbi:hypothetical protein [Salinimicrobium sp. GXAS 041]
MRTELYIALYPKGVIVVEISMPPAIIAEVLGVYMDRLFFIFGVNEW